MQTKKENSQVERLSSTTSVRGNDDKITDNFFSTIAQTIKADAIKKDTKIAFIVVCHMVPTLPYYLKALQHLGEIVCLIPKGHGAEANRDPLVFAETKKYYPLMEEVTRNTLSFENTLNEFLEKRINYKDEKNKDTHYVIIDEGGYFTNHPLPEEFNKKLLGIVETTENGHQRYERCYPFYDFSSSDIDSLKELIGANFFNIQAINSQDPNYKKRFLKRDAVLDIQNHLNGLYPDIAKNLSAKLIINTIKVPVYSIARTKIKATEDALVGKSIVHATESELRVKSNTMIDRYKKIGVMGFGKIGQSTASALKNNMQVKPVIFEPNSLRAIEAQGYEIAVNKNKEGNFLPPIYDLSEYDLLFCATGVGAIRGDAFKNLKNNVFIASCTSCEDEFDLLWLKDPANAISTQEGNYTIYTLKESGKKINFINHGNAANFLYNAVEGPSIYLVFAATLKSVSNLVNNKHLKIGKIHKLTDDEQAQLANPWVSYYSTQDSSSNKGPINSEVNFATLFSSIEEFLERRLKEFYDNLQKDCSSNTHLVKSSYETKREYVGATMDSGITFPQVRECTKDINQLTQVIKSVGEGSKQAFSSVSSTTIQQSIQEIRKSSNEDTQAAYKHELDIIAKDPNRNITNAKRVVGVRLKLFDSPADSLLGNLKEEKKEEHKSKPSSII